MRFGEAIDDDRLAALLRPGDGIDTVLTADTYGSGEADALLGRALRGVERESYCLVGAVGHDFYEGEREGAKGFPRFTDPRLRGPEQYASYLRMATERSLERVGVDRFDLLLLHNPDRIGYTSPAVWEGMAALRDAGLTRRLGVAPGPANGFTLDVIDCLERFGALIDWAMVILNPLEPWPGELVLPAARRYDVDLITRVVDYGGLFWDDVRPGHDFAQHDHRAFRPDGWVQAGRERLERMRPIAERHGLTTLQLACQWNLAHDRVRCAVPTLIEEPDRREAHRGQARRARRRPARARPLRRRGRRDPRDRRQHRLHGAQGRLAAVRGRAAARPLADDGRAARARRALGDRARARAVARDMTAPPAGKRGPGRRPGESGTQQAILDAARTQFAAHGWDRATIRAIARDADVDPALVLHFFGSKAFLFAAAMRWPFDTEAAVEAVSAARGRSSARGSQRSSCRSGRTLGSASRSWSCCALPRPTPRPPSSCARR